MTLLDRAIPDPRPTRFEIESWWMQISRWGLVSAIALMAIGVVLALALSPAVMVDEGVSPFYHIRRHLAHICVALAALIYCSTLETRSARRFGVILFALALVALIATPFIGITLNNARRWISLGFMTIQPSELAKPGLIIACAWMMSVRDDPSAPPGMPIAVALLALMLFLLRLQPDFGQSALISASWAVMFFLTGASLIWALSGLALAILGGALAYASAGYVRDRVHKFLFEDDGGYYQLRNARRAIEEGGLLGRGPGEGYYKDHVPDVEADFIYVVAAEEYGLALTLTIILLYAIISIGALWRLSQIREPFIRLAGGGLAALIAFQALIHMGVSAQLLPATGMTLPFVSAGGSSLVGSAITIGLLLALTRKRPRTGLEAMMLEERR